MTTIQSVRTAHAFVSRIIMSCLCLACALRAQAPFLGDWKGTLTTPQGEHKPVFAQVRQLPGNVIAATVATDIYTTKAKNCFTLTGQKQADTVRLAPGKAILTSQDFNGTTPWGTLELKPFRFISKTLGARPPEGATVILGPDTGLENFRNPRGKQGILDLNRLLGAQRNAVAYLQATVHADRETSALLKTGSDDGIVVFLNGTRIYTLDRPRPLVVDQDTIPITLRKGNNDLMLKIIQGGGDWQATARICDRNGKNIAGVTLPADHATDAPTNAGIIFSWNVAGPFTQTGGKLSEITFPPELNQQTQWRKATCPTPQVTRWKILPQGVIQVTPKGRSMVTAQAFGSGILHLEFKNAFMPNAMGQGRSNSGVYLQGRYEIQILDSYALPLRNNHCAGIYQQATPTVNMCLPPGQWQTYDIHFKAPQTDPQGNLLKDAEITLYHNGIRVHDAIRVKVTPGGLARKPAPKGPIMLQDHHNPVQFRNIFFQHN